MREFAKNLLSADGVISSKRFIAVWAMILYTGILILSAFGIQINTEFYYGTLGLVISSLGLTTFTKPTKNDLNIT